MHKKGTLAAVSLMDGERPGGVLVDGLMLGLTPGAEVFACVGSAYCRCRLPMKVRTSAGVCKGVPSLA